MSDMFTQMVQGMIIGLMIGALIIWARNRLKA